MCQFNGGIPEIIFSLKCIECLCKCSVFVMVYTVFVFYQVPRLTECRLNDIDVKFSMSHR